MAIEPAVTVTLALPKTGLAEVPGKLEVVDLGIPARGFEQAGIPYESPFTGQNYRISLENSAD